MKAKSVTKEMDFATALIVDIVATRFQVSSDVIERRLNFDQIRLTDLWAE